MEGGGGWGGGGRGTAIAICNACLSQSNVHEKAAEHL